jgi:signal transduction histidine kinase
VETQWQHKDGTLLDVLMSSAPIDPQDLSAGVTFTALDITRRKRAEEQALALSIEKERTHLIAQFIQAASHEFRTPLSMINLSAHVIERSTDSDQRKDRLEQIKTQVENITRLVNDLVTMARLDDGVLEDADWFDVNRILGNIEVALQSTADEAGVALNIESSQTEGIRIRGDLEELYTAVTNIVMNSLRYTPEGGTVTVRARPGNGTCVIDVQDTGIGMTEDEVSHIFERFYRVDEARTSGGFGLGLPIAGKIIERHNGHIEVESTPGQGSTFRIVIPCNEGK